MSEGAPKLIEDNTDSVCPVCGKPLDSRNHIGCTETPHRKLTVAGDFLDGLGDSYMHFRHQLGKAESDLSSVSDDEYKYLQELADAFLEEGNGYEARTIFEALQDFRGLRRVADKLNKIDRTYVDLSLALMLLEDHDAIRDLLNSQTDRVSLGFNQSFEPLRDPLGKYIEDYLIKNKTPVATGAVNEGVDLVAIRNLSQGFDVAVPIARGGLMQGAIADLWGMETHSVDIAAHNRKVPRGKWLGHVDESTFKEKDVLLFDKDAVTGASIRKTVKMIEPFNPSSISVYFTHPVGAMTKTDGIPSNVSVYSPKNAPLNNAGDAYIEAHEKLGTLYGRRMVIERMYKEDLVPKVKEKYPEVVPALESFLSRYLDTFDKLNPLTPGVEGLRKHILNRLKMDFDGLIEAVANNFYKDVGTKNLVGMFEKSEPLSVGFANDLVFARFDKQTKLLTEQRGINNLHSPSHDLAAFETAREAVNDSYDFVLLIGPEGFAYEAYFKDLGMQAVAVNIPESSPDGERSISILDDLSVLSGKKVLVVEDDIKTGATLKKLFETLNKNQPSMLGLYLGQPIEFQTTSKIPDGFSRVYCAGEGMTPESMSKSFVDYLAKKRVKLFKDD